MNKNKIARIFMFVFGVILVSAGLIVVIATDNLAETLKQHLVFFLSGGILIFLGLTWKKDKK